FEVWGKWTYVHWSGTQLFSFKENGGPFVQSTYLSTHAASAAVSIGDTLFLLSGTTGVYYTTDGGASFTTPTNKGYTGNLPKQLLKDGSRLYAISHLTTAPTVYTLLYTDDRGENWSEIDISAATNRKQVNGSPVSPIAAFIKGNHIELSFQQ